VSQKPQRPFVPHRTPTTARPAIAISEFRLYRPFVPGGGRAMFELPSPTDAASVAQVPSESTASLRPIEDFLDTSAPPATNYPRDMDAESYASELDDEPDALPPVEHFIDQLPVVDEFAPDGEQSLQGNGATASGEHTSAGSIPQDSSESGWLETDWQHYDWRAAAALGETASDEASSAWATTDWEGNVPRARDLRKSAAHAIATALDEIAQRIRAGEQVVPGSGALDPANIAATLAALLGIKR
jgi:hypothetical protein